MNCKIWVLLALGAGAIGLGTVPASARSSKDYLILNAQAAGFLPGMVQTFPSGTNIPGMTGDGATLRVSQADIDSKEKNTRSTSFSWSFERNETGKSLLAGNVPSEGLGKFLLIRAGDNAGQTLSVADGAPQGFNGTAIAAIKAAKALLSGSVSYENGAWSLKGFADSLATRQSLLEDLSKSTDLNRWNIVIRVLASARELNDTSELSDTAEQNDVTSRQVGPAIALQTCTYAVGEMAQGQAILFAPASATLTQKSLDTLLTLGGELQKCPSASVHVQGHTDADGPADTNMTLSVRRAEAVVSALIEAGVSDTRLYAIGFGETLPVASNQTRVGKAQNRRIVIELVQE